MQAESKDSDYYSPVLPRLGKHDAMAVGATYAPIQNALEFSK